MPVLSSQQIRAWDEFTIRNEPIASIDLMERAARNCVEWLRVNGYIQRSFSVFCGKGNNGGDGLAIARMLAASESTVIVYILEFGHKGTEDFQVNLSRLHNTNVEIRFIQSEEHLQAIPSNDIVIDALLGSGLNRPIENFTAAVVNHINNSGNDVISVDIPSGLFVDRSSKENIAVEADHTLSFQCQKPAFLVAENAHRIGNVHILDIGLHPDFLKTIDPVYEWIGKKIVSGIYHPRNLFAHKGNFGHAYIVAGSYGKMGAAVLCTRACLRSGAGLVTAHVPKCGLIIMQTSVPEAMCEAGEDEAINRFINTESGKFNAIGIGPGLGTDPLTAEMLKFFFEVYKNPLVLDADALNLIAANQLLSQIPKHSILTPHPKEFERLFGQSSNDFERIEKASAQAKLLGLTIVLKGHHTYVATPEGKGYFNSTGNPGMATGGTGDVLTGILTGLLAQQYIPSEAAIFGVYWHGAAGDLAAADVSEESLIASDIIDRMGTVLAAGI